MERVCFLARVRPGRLDEYRARHEAVWPEMRDALRAAGWGNYSLFLTGEGLLVGYLETDDYAAAQKRMAGTGQRALAGGDGPVLRRSRRPARTRASGGSTRSSTWTDRGPRARTLPGRAGPEPDESCCLEMT